MVGLSAAQALGGAVVASLSLCCCRCLCSAVAAAAAVVVVLLLARSRVGHPHTHTQPSPSPTAVLVCLSYRRANRVVCTSQLEISLSRSRSFSSSSSQRPSRAGGPLEFYPRSTLGGVRWAHQPSSHRQLPHHRIAWSVSWKVSSSRSCVCVVGVCRHGRSRRWYRRCLTNCRSLAASSVVGGGRLAWRTERG